MKKGNLRGSQAGHTPDSPTRRDTTRHRHVEAPSHQRGNASPRMLNVMLASQETEFLTNRVLSRLLLPEEILHAKSSTFEDMTAMLSDSAFRSANNVANCANNESSHCSREATNLDWRLWYRILVHVMPQNHRTGTTHTANFCRFGCPRNVTIGQVTSASAISASLYISII